MSILFNKTASHDYHLSYVPFLSHESGLFIFMQIYCLQILNFILGGLFIIIDVKTHLSISRRLLFHIRDRRAQKQFRSKNEPHYCSSLCVSLLYRIESVTLYSSLTNASNLFNVSQKLE